MQTITHREFRTWVAWNRDQLNNPSRSDYYLMQIAGYVAHVMSGKRWSLKDFVVKFKTDRLPQITREEQTKMAKSVWSARLGRNKRKQSPDGR